MGSITNSTDQKKCSRCQKKFPFTVEYFYEKPDGSGLYSACKSCIDYKRKYSEEHREEIAEYTRRYNKEHPEKVKETQQRYYGKNRDEILERARIYSAEHKEERAEYNRQYYEKNIEKELERVRRYRTQNPDKVREIDRKYKTKNVYIVRERSRRYKRENPAKMIVYDSNRRALERNAEGSHSNKDLQALYEMQTGKCCWCGKPIGNKLLNKLPLAERFYVDHIKPLSLNGTNWAWNLVLCCQWCSGSKSNRILFSEWQPSNMLTWMHDYVIEALQRGGLL